MTPAQKDQFVAECIGGRNAAVTQAGEVWKLNPSEANTKAYLKAMENDARSWAGVLGETDKTAIQTELLSIAKDAAAMSKQPHTRDKQEAVEHLAERLEWTARAAYDQAPAKPTENRFPRAPFSDEGRIITRWPGEPAEPFHPLPAAEFQPRLIEKLPD
jgi:hypothetical protein